MSARAAKLPALRPAAVADVLTRFVRGEAEKFGFTRGVLGISGGIDSAVSAALAARALGPRNVLGLLLPYRTSSPSSERLANVLAKKLGIKTERVDITAMVDGYLDAAGLSERRRGDRVRVGNVKSRARMIVVFDRSARDGSIVLGTSDKTEQLLGYTTWYGDSASAINPIGDLYKSQVYSLAEHLGVPKAIRSQSPTPDLWPGQSAEREMGVRYAEVDALLHDLIDRRLTPAEAIAAGHRRALVAWVCRRVPANQFKRRLPIVAKVSARTLNLDFRYLRDWGK